MACIKVIIANHQPFVCSGIRTALSTQPDLLVVGEARTKQDTISTCLDLKPNILLLDNVIIEDDRHALLHHLKNKIPNLEILILFNQEPGKDLHDYFSFGVKGCLMMDDEEASIVRAIRSVSFGDTWFSYSILEPLLRTKFKTAKDGTPGQPSPLSRRETEIMDCLAAGMSNHEIAQELTIAERTVRHHVEQIMMKLSVPNRTKVVIVAIKNEWITI